ncbi:zinc finger TRAF-type-containing protein 1-like isoform X2 [Tubulanus polymorphus]|uniref:zinc finger TRAF-type-containing protein 1-like isoform X2 n=1 Tax=Tubulanus polymorphus TaxID=672921 RepID=UPI003DA23B5F
MKFEPACSESDSKLEDRLNGILRCTVCLDLPRVSMYQCTNGHLMCAGCFAHLLADARLNDETSTCPNCRCEISKNLCSRNLAAEKAVSELPAECRFCSDQLPRHMLENHEGEKCLERLTNCEYDKIGCPWRGPYHELKQHAEQCTHPKKTGAEIMESLNVRDLKRAEEMKVYNKIHSMLSYEKITFVEGGCLDFRTSSETFMNENRLTLRLLITLCNNLVCGSYSIGKEKETWDFKILFFCFEIFELICVQSRKYLENSFHTSRSIVLPWQLFPEIFFLKITFINQSTLN